MSCRNSLFVDVLDNLSSKVSAASMTFIGDIALLKNEVFSKMSEGTRSSSFLVPDEARFIAGQSRNSATFLSRIISLLPVPLNS